MPNHSCSSVQYAKAAECSVNCVDCGDWLALLVPYRTLARASKQSRDPRQKQSQRGVPWSLQPWKADKMRRTLGRRQPRVQTLEIFRREAAQIGAEGGELPAVGADPEAMGLDRLSEGDTLEVPTGRSVLDVLQLSGICADGLLATRDEERRQNLRDGLRWHQGQNDPNPRGWKTIDRLAQVDPSWFCRLVPDETRPIRFAVVDGVTGSVETFTTLTLKRVAGQAQRITFREADRDEITLDDWLAANVGGDGNAEV